MTIPANQPVDSTPRTTPRNLFAGMNGTEREYAIRLEAQKRDGLIHDWFYESLTFKLAQDCRYTPDFLVIENDGRLVFHETKGFMRDDALVKLRVCAKQFPFPLFLHRLEKGCWTTTDFTTL